MARPMRPGDRVRLRVPENPRLDGAFAEVEAPTDYGARVLTAAAATGRFRALHEEMVPLSATGEVCSCCGGVNLVRAGACNVCLDCGTSGGCG